MSAVFVFGSNLAGNHAGGAARHAFEQWGAIMGQGVGRQGQSYAIPTLDGNFTHIGIGMIGRYVREFLTYAAANPGDSFLVTAIGCGIAGMDPAEIAPLFAGATENVFLSEKLVAALRQKG